MQFSEHTKTIVTLAVVGAVLTIGKLLADGEKLNIKRMVGRVIVGSGLSMAAASILTLYPDLPVVGLVGVASVLSTLGVHFLEDIVSKKFGGSSE